MPDEYVEIDTELLLLAANDSARDRQEILDRLRDMRPSELRLLREAVNRLDEALDTVALELRRK